MVLHFLDFDASDDGEGAHSWDAMACVGAERLPELLAEIAAVLAWAGARFTRGALDDGADWDYDLQCEQDSGPLTTLQWDSQRIAPLPTLEPSACVTLSLTLAGSDAFAQAFCTRFDLR